MFENINYKELNNFKKLKIDCLDCFYLLFYKVIDYQVNQNFRVLTILALYSNTIAHKWSSINFLGLKINSFFTLSVSNILRYSQN